MKKIISVLTLGVLLSQCQGAGSQTDLLKDPKINSGETVAKVSGVELKEGFLDALVKALPNVKEKLDNPIAKKKLVESILEQELLYQEGVRRGLLDNPDVSMKVLINQRSVIASALMQDELDKAMGVEYEKRKESDFTKVALSQIVIPFQVTEAKKDKKPVTEVEKKAALKLANEVAKKIKGGESFEELAKKHSSEKRTAERGGVAGHVAKIDKRYEKQGLKAVVAKAFELKENDVSDPIETELGYYIIKVTSKPQVTSFEEAKKVLSFDLQNQIKTQIVDQLKKQYPIEFVGVATPETKPEAHSADDGHNHGSELKPQEMKQAEPSVPATENVKK